MRFFVFILFISSSSYVSWKVYNQLSVSKSKPPFRSIASQTCNQVFQPVSNKNKVFSRRVGLELEYKVDKNISRVEIAKKFVEHLKENYGAKEWEKVFPIEIFMEIKSGRRLFNSASEVDKTFRNQESMLRFFEKYLDYNILSVNIQYKYKDKIYKWSVDHEDSMGKLHVVEIISPVLERREEAQVFYSLIERLNSIYKFTGKDELGFHIHVDASQFNRADQGTLLKTLLIVEQSLYNYFGSSKKRFTHIAPLSQFVNKARGEIIDLRESLLPTDKEHGIIYSPHWETIEFRFFNSTTSVEKMNFAIEFSTRLMQAVEQKNPRLIQFIEKHEEVSSGDIHELFEVLKLDQLVNFKKREETRKRFWFF